MSDRRHQHRRQTVGRRSWTAAATDSAGPTSLRLPTRPRRPHFDAVQSAWFRNGPHAIMVSRVPIQRAARSAVVGFLFVQRPRRLPRPHIRRRTPAKAPSRQRRSSCTSDLARFRYLLDTAMRCCRHGATRHQPYYCKALHFFFRIQASRLYSTQHDQTKHFVTTAPPSIKAPAQSSAKNELYMVPVQRHRQNGIDATASTKRHR